MLEILLSRSSIAFSAEVIFSESFECWDCMVSRASRIGSRLSSR